MLRNCGRLAILAVILLLYVFDLRAGDANADDLNKMQGKWKAVETIDSGSPVGKDVETIFTVSQKSLQIAEGKNPVLEFTISLDASKKPKQIDVSLKGKAMLGIYELKGDTWRICFSQPGKARPSAFVSKDGDDLRLVTLQRRKADK